MSRGKPFDGARSPSRRRPGYEADRRRRRAFVSAYLRAHGKRMGKGAWSARCEVCGHTLVLPLSEWWADHVTPVALGGSEHGPLRLSCKDCQLKQGSKVGNASNPMARPRKRPSERHPGVIE